MYDLNTPPPRPPKDLPSSADRDNEAVDAIQPYLDELSGRCEASGWVYDEIHAVVASWVVHRMCNYAHHVGTELAWNAVEVFPEQIQEAVSIEIARLLGRLPTIPKLDDLD
jgi:hypothetical protein